MKRLFCTLVMLILVLALLPNAAFAATSDVYVSAAGSDENAGTEQYPYQTLYKAFSEVSDGGTIHIVGTVSVPADFAWPSYGKAYSITGGTLDFTAMPQNPDRDAYDRGADIFIGDDVHFHNITLNFHDPGTSGDTRDNLYAKGNKVTIGEGVTFNQRIQIFGGDRGAAVASTDLTILSGNYYAIYGGGRGSGATVEGDTNLLVGGNTNDTATPFEEEGHNEDYMVFGAGHTSTVEGVANLTFTGNAKANYIYGGTKMGSSAAVGHGTNLVFSGGQVFGIYGGSYVNAQGSDVNLKITGGKVEQVFGGCYESSLDGSVDLQVLGGEITRRLYGGCYNNYAVLSGWESSYAVQGHIRLMIGGDTNISFTSTSSDKGIFARSRQKTVSGAETSELVFLNAAAYSAYKDKLGTQDWSIMSSVTAADVTHYFTYTADGGILTGTCNCGCSITPKATLSLDPAVSLLYTGDPITPAKVKVSDWYGDKPVITYENNTQVGTATASITAGDTVASVNFAITEASTYSCALTLNESIAINFRVSKDYLDAKGFETVEFYMDGEVLQTITSLPTASDGYIFTFSMLTPAQMGKKVTAKFYFADDTQENVTMSVLQYCMSILENEYQSQHLKRAAVDILNYGAASQNYAGLADGEVLVNANLGDYANLGTTGTPELTKHTYLEPRTGTEQVTWLGAGLNLKGAVSARLKFNTESIEGLSLKLTCGTSTWTTTKFEATDGGYYAYVNGLNPIQLRQRIYAEFYNAENEKVSQKLTYSVESYAYSVAGNNAESAELKALMAALMRYSDAVSTWVASTGYDVVSPVDVTVSVTEPDKQVYTFEGINASKNYYIEIDLSAPTKEGYVGIAHLGSDSDYFYDIVSYDNAESYIHAFSSVVNGTGREYTEPANYYSDTTAFGTDGMTFAALRLDDVVYTFVNGKRIGTYLLEEQLAMMNTVPALYFYGDYQFYNGKVSNVQILSDAAAVQAKLADLTAGSDFGYVNTPNWNKENTDATFNDDGFTYTYDASVSTGDRRYVTGVNDRVFLAGNYYYQYEISGDITSAGSDNVYGLLFNWINTKTLTKSGNYKHEVNFVLKLNGDKLQRLTFDKGSGANGDGSSGWVSNTTSYGGRNDLENDSAWQAAFKGGLTVRIERTVVNSTTDSYVITVTAKSNPELKITSTSIEVSDDTFGGYNWILFGTQSVDCTISNVTFGRLHTYSEEGVVAKAPTCSETGIVRYYCTDPGFAHLYKEEALPVNADNHTTWNYAYTWSGGECTAIRQCVCGKSESETVQGKLVSITPATKSTAGRAVYNATFQNADFQANATDICTGYEAELPANTPFSITEGGKQQYAFDGIAASKQYYIEMQLSASTAYGYVSLAHWADASNYFYSAVSYSGTENSYYHAFSGVVNGEGKVYKEPSTYYNDTANFAVDGLKLAVLRQDDVVYTFVNGKRVGTYLIESELSALDTIPVLYFEDANDSFYNGSVSEIVVVSDETEVATKLAELTAGSEFAYVNTPNWDTSKGTRTDATFNDDGFTYAYDASVSTGDRRYVTGVNDRVFLAGNYYYQYEISGDIISAGSNNVYGLLFNWINTKTLSEYETYRHEANFVLKLNGDKLQRLTFDKGSGANGDGTSGWVSNTTTYGGRNDLESDTTWQEAFKSGLIIRIERTAFGNNTDTYVISVTAKSDPSLKLTSTSIEVTDDTFGGYNWMLFGTQSVDCTISNVTYGHLHTWEYSYTWSENACTATRQCLTCNEKETETVQGQLESVRVPTNETTGEAIYTADFQNGDFDANFTDRVVEIAANTKHYAVEGITAGKNYYMEVNISAPTASGYVGLAHWADVNNHFYDVVSYDAAENYYHGFSGVVNGSGRVYKEPAKYYNDTTAFGTEGMTFATLRMGDVVHTFVNGKRIGTYLIESELAKRSTVPVLYFDSADGNYYNGSISEISIVSDEAEVQAKLAELTAGSEFSYVNTPNWDTTKGTRTDAAFNEDGFTYAYDSSVSTGDRRYVNGVNDRVFLAGNYYYQYEISGEMTYANSGLLFNWINTKSLTEWGYYKHEVNFVLKLTSGSALERLTFDKGSGANGDGSAGWSCNTTAYGGNNTLASSTAWQEAFKDGLIVRIERTVKDSTTDSYVISVTAKINPELKITSTPIEVSDDTFGGYNWILFGTQSVDCTISNVSYGHIHNWNYTYQWNDSQCTATRQCECGETENETVQGQLVEVIYPATKNAAGKATYNATFQNADFQANATADCTGHETELPANTPFSITEGGKQQYAFDGIAASKQYYIEMQLSASTAYGYVSLAHWADASNYFYSAVSYSGTENSYYHAFSGVVNGEGKVYKEPSTYYNDTANFAVDGLKLAVLRQDDVVYTFVNGKRVGTYLIESELSALDTIPVLYFEDANDSFYNGSVSEIVVVSDETEVATKLAELTAGSEFAYVNTPNWDTSKGTRTDATFNDDGFTYAYDASVSAGDRRFVTGVNDRVFLAGDYYYQYEISGDIANVNANNVYGLLFSWINSKSLTGSNNYKHEVNFVFKLNGDKLQRLTFDKGSGANGDGSSGWVSNTTAYGGRNDLENDAAWQAAYKSGLIVRIERTVKDSKTDIYVISVTAKSDPSLKLTSDSIEVSDDTFGGYNWILFGTQSVNCTISNVTFGQNKNPN